MLLYGVESINEESSQTKMRSDDEWSEGDDAICCLNLA